MFVLQSITGSNIIRLAVDALPFFMLMLVAVLLISVFPDIVMFLPDQMNR